MARQSEPPEEPDDFEEDDRIRRVAAVHRTKFFGYLALLSGGAILLSVSFLGSLLGKGVLSAVAVLFAGWLALLMALFGSLFRALLHQAPSRAHPTTVPTVRPLSLSHRAGDAILEEEEDHENVGAATALSREHLRRTRISETLAIHGFWMGTVLLVIFAGYNAVAVNHTPAPEPVTTSGTQNSGTFSPPDVSEGSSRAASCAEAARVAAACTQAGINTEPVEPFASKGGYQIPLPPIADVPRGFRPDPNPKDCDTAEQWQNYCHAHP